MNSYHDPELEDVLQDDELRRIASMLSTARVPEPPLDEAFRTGLRRQLMNEAWSMTEGRVSWFRRAFAPPGLAWAGAAAGLVLIISVVVFAFAQHPGGFSTTIAATSPIDGNRSVALEQPILVAFNQPMDHSKTEQAVQITPATNVTFAWHENTLAVQPTGGTLAPNTQYQVTIGSGARTASGQPLTSQQTRITFVTKPPATPAPAPTPRPTPSAALGATFVTTLGGASTLVAQWAPDSSSIYFVDGRGALNVVSSKGGQVTVIANGGASSPSIAPAGDRLAYIRGGRIEVLTFASGKTDELSPAPAPTIVGWAKDRIVWAASDGVYALADDGSSRLLAALPTTGTVAVVSIAPDGAHAALTQDQNLFVLDLSSGKSAQVGSANSRFETWSPGGSLLIYATTENVVVADLGGNKQATLPAGDAAWSSQDAILIGGDTDIIQTRPDGTNLGRISNGTFHSPLWAPNGTGFAFVRGGALWTATAPALPSEPTALDDASQVVTAFMDARLNKQADVARAQLDDNGKAAYASGGLSLIIDGDPSFTRYYVLASEITGSQPDTARFTVRLVLSHGKIDVSNTEETLTLVRDAASKQFLIDQATSGSRRDLGKGATVVNVDVQPETIKVTFDSDLDPTTVNDGVTVLDSKGKRVDATASYTNRVVTLTGLNLKEGDSFRLVVSTAVRDVSGQAVTSEYDLDFPGPSAKKHVNRKDVGTSPSNASPGG